jgi:hypothetical protein
MQMVEVPQKKLSARELLSVWEQGMGQLPADQALQLLAAASPEVPRQRLAKLSIGQRDAGLLTLREWTFGPRLEGIATCPACVAQSEVVFDVNDISAGPRTVLVSTNGEDDRIETYTMSVAGYDLTFRPPNSLDLQPAGTVDAPEFRRMLLDRCVLSVCRGNAAKPVSELPAEVLAALLERMEQVDPQANVQLALACPDCAHEWQSIFDVASFFWGEIHVWAHRTLREVHALASAYGWGEAEILSMSPWRREMYLRMVSR